MKRSNPVNRSVPAIGEGRRGVAGHIGYLLRQAHLAHAAAMERVLAAEGMTLPQFTALTMLGAYPGASGAELAQLALLTPQTMTVILSNLEKRSWVVRRPHARHGRILQAHLTPAGKRKLAAARRAVVPWERRLLTGASPAEETIVRRWLVAVALGAARQ